MDTEDREPKMVTNGSCASSLLLSSLKENDLAASIKILEARVGSTGSGQEENSRVGTPYYLAPELWRD